MFLALALLFLWLFYKWSVNNLEYFKKIGVPYEKPLPLFGNALGLLLKKQSFIDLTRNSYYKFKNSSRIFGFFNFRQINYFITDPELIKRITIKDFEHFTNKDSPMAHADKVFSRILPFLRDKEWTDMRSTLSPIFTSSKMKMMYGLLSDQARDFVNFFEEKSQRGETLEMDAKNIFARFTANGIATSALGFEADCVRNVDSDVFKLVGTFINEATDTLTILKGFLFMTIPSLYKLLGFRLLSKEMYNFFKRVVIDQMDERDRNKTSRPDIIQLMLQLKKGQLRQDKENEVNDKELINFSANVEYEASSKGKSTSQFTDDDWIAQGFVFFGAGFDTTSTLLQTTCYELMKNPDIQLELYNEIDSVASTLDGRSVSFEALHKMTFLDMVVSEGLRKWPPIIQTNRICTKDYFVPLGNGSTITIKKDQQILFPYFHIQNDPAYFPNPEKFDPYRFANENKDSIVQGSYLPFGLGRRNCIGSRFALMEAKLLLFHLVHKFSIEKCVKTPETIKHKEGFMPSIKETVYLKFVPRK
ncbi:probable cytochrome P450 9f2 [Bradysia coprophila]|uniref:probable cytochrome P450 9f2 n=1 Tax=Bradysia coprophila TaxID=38358 RepID=UPI00187D70BC|nr:probable cytochrome P450 9f2 [Bradysia coprophila]